ncbi:hypothetical protein ASPACDRAFT_48368 [Aspergillus aculeatus ATCC 16872]|uniref:Uncharacterized protein n=1 Tax=Aspergillus aculeatus (strain ATCC 16872 / CBS 172.66 / WB 5094) TaxID=690307 RepID=A0A1L9WFG9_ASPA1|nr:uncharacterized protein ASPACDRAFT_48368 [Aspergillus aculeatus ATCC 16872]OJJ94920.1 hypothetical protein ASPACDRAFT_48368 [Aspergillus aculeatus ATCC 16872]
MPRRTHGLVSRHGRHKQASVNLNAAGLELIGDDVSANPAFAVRKLSATSSQNAVNLISYWTDCAAEPQCNAGFTLWTTGHGKVYDADKGVYTGDGCHGGGKGFNRGLCVESDVQAVNCQWYGKAKGCSQTCPAGTILLAQNTHISGASTGCKTGHFSSYCCEEIYTNSLAVCPQTNVNNALTGGLGVVRKDATSVRLLKDAPDLSTFQECFWAIVGFLSLVAAGNYLVNNIPGHWNANGQFQPQHNRIYPASVTSQACTTTTTSHTTITTLTSSPKTVTCDGNRYPQACAHYSSVIDLHQYSTLICPVNKLVSRTATSTWNEQHVNAWRSWVPNLPARYNWNHCDRHEYPPFAYVERTGSPYTQWIRLLPSSENRGGGPITSSTCTEIVSTIYTLNGLVMEFTNVQGYSMSDNPCLPVVITDDPGFALFTNDPWYVAVQQQHNSAAYALPPVAALTQGKTAPRIGRNIAKRESSDFWVVDEGNSSRQATPEEVFEDMGLIRCESTDCEKELKEMGLLRDHGHDRDASDTTSSAPVVLTTPLEATPGSRTDSRKVVVPSQPIETGRGARNHLERHRRSGTSHHH